METGWSSRKTVNKGVIINVFFSILVPVYNTSAYLRECVESVLCQTFSDYELILLDDGSPDISGASCDAMAREYPSICVIHKRNEGLMMTRRLGFKAAQGKYFICLDSDDYLCDPCALEKIHACISHTGCDLVLYDYIHGEGGGRPQRNIHLFDRPDEFLFSGDQKTEVYEKLLTTNVMNNIWLKCPSRDIVDTEVDYSQWKQDICRAEDLFQSYPLLDNACKIGYVAQPLYYYRWAPNSISNKCNFNYYNAYRCIYQREDAYLQRWAVGASTAEMAYRDRIPGVCSVISINYEKCRQAARLDDWRDFLCRIADDPFFEHLLDHCNRENVLLYYRLIHYFTVRKRCGTVAAVIRIVSFLSQAKHTILGR